MVASVLWERCMDFDPDPTQGAIKEAGALCVLALRKRP